MAQENTKNKEDYNAYDEEVIDTDEVIGADVKITPQFYIHHALIKAQKCLSKDNLGEGLVQFRFLVEHIEVLCRAAGMLSGDYETNIQNFIKSKEYADLDKEQTKSVNLANKKIELLMQEVFSSTVSTNPLKA